MKVVNDIEIPHGCYKEFVLKTGRRVRLWGNEVLEALNDQGEWRIVSEKQFPRFASAILEAALDQWDDVPTIDPRGD